MSLQLQFIWLFTLALPIACVAWTVTHEEVFREPREFCIKCSKEGRTLLMRKFFYLFTCEYCFSHYVTVAFLLLTDYKLLMDDWRGYIVGGFALVWVANFYMSLFARIRIDLKRERTEVSVLEKQDKVLENQDAVKQDGIVKGNETDLNDNLGRAPRSDNTSRPRSERWSNDGDNSERRVRV